MSREFTFHQKGMAHHERPRRRAAFLTRVWFKIDKANPPFRVRRDGGEEGPPRTVPEIRRIVRQWSKTAEVGARLDLLDDTLPKHDQIVYHFRCVEVAPAVPAPDTAPPLGPLYVRVVTRHGWVTNLGNWYCRFIAGTHEVSRHGYYALAWKGAAQDFGADSAQHLEDLAEEIVHWATDATDEFYGKIATVIVHDRIWTRNEGWHHYSGIYHYHVHVDVDEGVPCSP